MATNFDKAQVIKEALSIIDGSQEKGALTVYNGNPNGNVTGTVGALCIDYSGSGKLWKNTDGSTTWVEVGASGGGGSPYFDDDGGTPTTPPNASGSKSIAIGNGATVGSGANDSLAIGTSASIGTNALSAISIGTASNVGNSCIASIAIGVYSQCTNGFNIAIGTKAKVNTNSYSIAIGSSWTGDTVASGANCIALGRQANSAGSGSISIGRNAQSTSVYSIAIGSGSTTSNSANAVGHSSVAIGHACISNNFSISIGRSANANGNNSIAIGKYSYCNNHSYSICIGTNSSVGGSHTIAIGSGMYNGALVSGGKAIAIGSPSQANGQYSIAIGEYSSAIADESISIGKNSNASVPRTVQIQGVSITKKDSIGIDANSVFRDFASNEAIIMTKEIDLTAMSDTTIQVPTGAKFYPNEVGIIFTSGIITSAPTISFGITGDTTKFLGATATTISNVFDRNKFSSVSANGESSLVASITSAGSGTNPKGRFYFKGMLVENQ